MPGKWGGARRVRAGHAPLDPPMIILSYFTRPEGGHGPLAMDPLLHFQYPNSGFGTAGILLKYYMMDSVTFLVEIIIGIVHITNTTHPPPPTHTHTTASTMSKHVLQ